MGHWVGNHIIAPDVVVNFGATDISPSSGSGTSIQTFNAVSKTGDVVGLGVHWVDTGASAISSITWGGVAGSVLVQAQGQVNSHIDGAAIVVWDGDQSGNIVITMTAAPAQEISIGTFDLENVATLAAIDTSTATSSALTVDSPGPGGVRLYAQTAQSGDALTWTGATEMYDINGGAVSERISMAYDIGDDGTSVSSNADSGLSRVTVGVAIR